MSSWGPAALAAGAVAGARPGAGWSTDRDFGLEVLPDAPVTSLSIGERQRVEILKALYRDARVLVLDEPTAVLTPQEAERLFQTLDGLVGRGWSSSSSATSSTR